MVYSNLVLDCRDYMSKLNKPYRVYQVADAILTHYNNLEDLFIRDVDIMYIMDRTDVYDGLKYDILFNLRLCGYKVDLNNITNDGITATPPQLKPGDVGYVTPYAPTCDGVIL